MTVIYTLIAVLFLWNVLLSLALAIFTKMLEEQMQGIIDSLRKLRHKLYDNERNNE